MMKRTIVLSVLLSSFILPVASLARLTTLSGGAEVGYEIFDRSYDNEESETTSGINRSGDDSSRISLSPFITILSESERDSLEFSYSPRLYYDFEESGSDIDHQLFVGYGRALTQRWSTNLSDEFVISDDFNSFDSFATPDVEDDESAPVVAAPVQEDVLRDEPGRRRYYTNEFEAFTAYNYQEDSFVTLGYGYNLLRNEETGPDTNYEDYDKHSGSLSIANRFNAKSKLTVSGRYVKGLFDEPTDVAPIDPVPTDETDEALTSPAETVVGVVDPNASDDVEEYYARLFYESNHIIRHPMSLAYEYVEANYEDELSDDSLIHSLTFGWQWLTSPTTNVIVGAGPTYSEVDGEDGEWRYNGFLTAGYTMQKGSINFTADAGSALENFSGTDEKGVVQFYGARASINYSVLEYVNVNAYASYRNEEQDELVPLIDTAATDPAIDPATTVPESELFTIRAVTTDTYAAGCGVSYQFHENYVTSLNYRYVTQSSDLGEDEYSDHRVQLSLRYEDDFFQW